MPIAFANPETPVILPDDVTRAQTAVTQFQNQSYSQLEELHPNLALFKDPTSIHLDHLKNKVSILREVSNTATVIYTSALKMRNRLARRRAAAELVKDEMMSVATRDLAREYPGRGAAGAQTASEAERKSMVNLVPEYRNKRHIFQAWDDMFNEVQTLCSVLYIELNNINNTRQDVMVQHGLIKTSQTSGSQSDSVSQEAVKFDQLLSEANGALPNLGSGAKPGDVTF